MNVYSSKFLFTHLDEYQSKLIFDYLTRPFTIKICYYREPKEYMLDIFNYLDLSGYSLILITFVFRYLQRHQQWTFGSLAVLVNVIGIFKYSIGSR